MTKDTKVEGKESRKARSAAVVSIVVIAAIVVVLALALLAKQPSAPEQPEHLTFIAGYESNNGTTTEGFFCPGHCKVFWNATEEDPAKGAYFTIYLYNGSGSLKAVSGGFTGQWEVKFAEELYLVIGLENVATWHLDVYSCSA